MAMMWDLSYFEHGATVGSRYARSTIFETATYCDGELTDSGAISETKQQQKQPVAILLLKTLEREIKGEWSDLLKLAGRTQVHI